MKMTFFQVSHQLKSYESEFGTKQSCSYENRHFYKKLYLNPGLNFPPEKLPRPGTGNRAATLPSSSAVHTAMLTRAGFNRAAAVAAMALTKGFTPGVNFIKRLYFCITIICLRA